MSTLSALYTVKCRLTFDSEMPDIHEYNWSRLPMVADRARNGQLMVNSSRCHTLARQLSFTGYKSASLCFTSPFS